MVPGFFDITPNLSGFNLPVVWGRYLKKRRNGEHRKLRKFFPLRLVRDYTAKVEW